MNPTVSNARAAVFFNPSANRGGAQAAWSTVEPALRQVFPQLTVVTPDTGEGLTPAVAHAFQEGVRVFIAAGGDGTLQGVLDGLLFLGVAGVDLAQVTLGAIGLGTSNDFHKPLDKAPRLAGFPARVGPTATPHDVIRLELTGADGGASVRHCLQSSHLGTIPSANFRLTRRNGLFNTFYRLWYAGALALVSAWEVFTFPGFQARITVDSETWEGSFSGISLLKRGHVAGSFFFKTDRTPDDGRFDLGACNKVSPWKLIGLVGQYETKGLDLPPDMRFRVATSATAEFSHPQPLDFDGELALVRKVKWTLLPRALPVFG